MSVGKWPASSNGCFKPSKNQTGAAFGLKTSQDTTFQLSSALPKICHRSEARSETSSTDLYGGVCAFRLEARRNRRQRLVSGRYSAEQCRNDVRWNQEYGKECRS